MALDDTSANALADAVLDLENLADARTLQAWLGGDAEAKPVLR